MKKATLSTLLTPILMVGATTVSAGLLPQPDWTFDVNHTNWTGYESSPINDSVTDPFDEWVLSFNSQSIYTGLNFVDTGYGHVSGFRPSDDPFDSEGINGDFNSAGNGEITFVWDDITGYLVSNGSGGYLPIYTGGTIKMWYQSPRKARVESTGVGYGDGTWIADLRLTGGGAVADLASFTVELFGKVDNVADGWLSFVEGGFGAFENYTNVSGDPNNDNVTWLFQFDAVANDFNPIAGVISRRNEGSGSFDVPAPAPLALLGIGLIGLGFSKRKSFF
jgi:hypothetical protein